MSFNIFEKDDFAMTINVENPINFGIDASRNALIELRGLFESKCLENYFIIEIVEIVHRSRIRFDIQSKATMDVVFRAKVMQYVNWGIITNVKIIDNRPIIIGETEFANVSILNNNNQMLESIGIGQIVPVRIMKIGYEHRKKVSIVALLLMPDKGSEYFNITKQLPQTKANELMPLIDQIAEEVNKRDSLNPEALAFYEKVLFSTKGDLTAEEMNSVEIYDGGPAWRGKSIKGVEKITDIVHKCASGETMDIIGVWSRTIDIPKTSPYAKKIINHNGRALEISTYDAFRNMLNNMLMFLVAIRELTEVDRREENENVWFIMTH